MKPALIIDGMNQLHRARSGFKLGPAPVMFNFMRGLRALIEKFDPSRVIMALEGHPKHRVELLGEYKGNRKVEEGTPQFDEIKEFHRQVDEIVDIMSRHFPISIVRHPDFEADDCIFNLIRMSSSTTQWVVASNDSDFIQLYDDFPEEGNVTIYNPMKKEFVARPDFNYVTWKALRGDSSDNIPGIISDAKALEMVNDPELLAEAFLDEQFSSQFSRNYRLIKFYEWDENEGMKMSSSQPIRNWDVVKTVFEGHGFKSIIEPKYWDNKFVPIFDALW